MTTPYIQASLVDPEHKKLAEEVLADAKTATQGPQGAQGAQGPQGAQGAQGPQGDVGEAGSSSSGTLGLVQISDGAGGFDSDAGFSYSNAAFFAPLMVSATYGLNLLYLAEPAPGVLDIGNTYFQWDTNQSILSVDGDFFPKTGNAKDLGSSTPQPNSSVSVFDTPAAANEAVYAFTPGSPVVPGTVVLVSVGTGATITDDGAGNLIGDIGSGGTNTVDYGTGVCNFSFSSGPSTGANVSAVPVGTLAPTWRTGYFGTSVETVALNASANVDAATFSVASAPGIDGTITTADGEYTFTKGLLTGFTPA